MTYFGYLYLYTDRTGEKIVHYTSLILNEFAVKCIRLVFVTSNTNIDILSLLEFVWKTTACMETPLR